MDEGYDYGHVEKPAYVSALSRQIAGDHYKKYKIQPAEYMHANNIPFLEGEAISYITRWRDKNGLSDVRKAIHILEILIQLEETKEKHERRLPASGPAFIDSKIPVGIEATKQNNDYRVGEWKAY